LKAAHLDISLWRSAYRSGAFYPPLRLSKFIVPTLNRRFVAAGNKARNVQSNANPAFDQQIDMQDFDRRLLRQGDIKRYVVTLEVMQRGNVPAKPNIFVIPVE
jgi:hypothetical protein